MKIRLAMRRLLVHLLSALVVFPPGVLATVAPDPGEDVALVAKLEKLDRYKQLIKQIREKIDRSQFDLSAVLDELEYDPNRVVDFVTRQVSFEQYPGLLRGAQGTLMSGAGNSLDQSVLLATLLKDAGYDARISRTSIDRNTATRLVNTMKLRTVTSSAIGDQKQISGLLGSLLVEVAGASEKEATEKIADLFATPADIGLPKVVEEDARFVRERVQPGFGDEDRSTSGLVAEAQDYFWVEWRESQGDQWVAVHPAFGGENPGTTIPKPVAVYADTIPRELEFLFRIEITTERRLGSTTAQSLIATTPDAPSANLIGVPLTAALVPDSIKTPEDLAYLEKSLKKASIWIPMLNGSPATYAFDYLGNTIDSLAAGAPGAALFQTVGGNFASAAGALSGSPGDKPIAGLEHVWIDYIVTHPGGREERNRTDLLAESLLQRSGGYDDQDIARKGMLSSTHTAMLAVGSYPAAYVLDRSLERAQQLVEITQSEFQDGAQGWTENLSRFRSDFIGHLDFFQTIDASMASSDVLSYRPAPAIVVFSQAFSSPNQALALLNIVDNPRRSLVSENGMLMRSPEWNILAGVWESTLEGLMLATADRSAFSAANTLAELASNGEEFSLIPAQQKIALNPPWRASTTGEWIDADLGRGRSVLIPSSQVSAPDATANWWRIDPHTGETLAVMGGGYGIALTEELIFKISVGSALLAMTAAFWGCMGRPDAQGNPPDASRGKTLGCVTCGLFAFAATYLAVGTVLVSGPATFAAWRGGSAITVTVETTAGAQLKKMAWELASIVMGVFCGAVAVAS